MLRRYDMGRKLKAQHIYCEILCAFTCAAPIMGSCNRAFDKSREGSLYCGSGTNEVKMCARVLSHVSPKNRGERNMGEGPR